VEPAREADSRATAEADAGPRHSPAGRSRVPPPSVETIREVVEALAPIERAPCSDGERRAAEWLAARLSDAGCDSVRLEEERAFGIYLPTLACLGLAATAGAALVLRGQRAVGAAISLVAASALVDEAQNGPRLLRRALLRARRTVNVVASVGEADRRVTLVVLAHHDAHRSGRLYDQSPQRALHRLAPALVARARRSFPQWWLGLAGPALAALAAWRRRAGPARVAIALNLLGTALVAEAARSPTTPGANDNLSGVAGLVALAEMLRDRPLSGLRVLLVSCGAEEALQEGVRAFLARHRGRLDRSRTRFLNLETVGSPRLILLEGEGPIWIEDYSGAPFRDLVCSRANAAGVAIERGFRARASTDSVIPSRAGYPTATLTSITAWGALANYHLPTDTPENVDYDTVASAVRVAYAAGEALSATI
jgi:hypothetical protein